VKEQRTENKGKRKEERGKRTETLFGYSPQLTNER
jgi:hypothetical protein